MISRMSRSLSKMEQRESMHTWGNLVLICDLCQKNETYNYIYLKNLSPKKA
jgi:hypothetical protein